MTIMTSRRWAVALAAVAVGLGGLGTSAAAAVPSPAVSAPAPLAALTAAPHLEADAASMTATGRLIDENGWPVSGMTLYVTPADGGAYFNGGTVTTGADGSFSISVSDPYVGTYDPYFGTEEPPSFYPARIEFYENGFGPFTDVPPVEIALLPGTITDLGTITIRAFDHVGRAAGSVNTASKKAVRKLYRTGFAAKVRQEKRVSVSGCSVAATPKKQQKRELSALNTVRSLAGVEPVSLSAKLSKKASKAALIQYWQGYLSHYPSDKARCHTKTGIATSARSNLSLADVGAVNILGYMIDPGSNNRAAGHRAWFLSPGLEKVGTGYAGRANAFYVVSKQDDANTRPLWVTWPTAGWFPAQFEPWGRWSFTSPRLDLDFSRAKVTMHVAGKKVKLSVYRAESGAGYLNGLAWDLAKPITVRGTKTVAATVTVSNIGLRGTSTLPPVTYTVKLFNA